MSEKIIVSVIIPVLNEEKYISICVESLLKQSFPITAMEWLFVDVGSTDETKKIINEYCVRYGELIRILDNPNKIQASAMNIGIKNSIGKYIIRLDAHAEYDNKYIENCIKQLDSGVYDNVGGIAITKGRTPFGKIVACMMSSKFGVGNSQFRTSCSSGLVDTVPFGAFPRETFEKYGFFDERLARNEDNEINYRIRKNGGKVFLSSDIKFIYYCRDTLGGILNMAFQNGKWTIIASRLCPGSMGIRHLIPLVFVLSLIILATLSFISVGFAYLLLFELALYFAFALFFSIKVKQGIDMVIKLLLLFPLFHISYGCGSLCGIGKTFLGVAREK